MTDISKCSNHEGCTVKNTCRRFTCIVDIFSQSWSKFEPTKGRDCSGYYAPMSAEEIAELKKDPDYLLTKWMVENIR